MSMTKAKQILFNNSVASLPNTPDTTQRAIEELKTLVDANVLTVAAGSTQYLDITANEISISALAITNVTTGTEADLATWIAANYTGGNELQEGDTLILTTPGEAYIHNGGSAGTAADFTLIETPGITDSEVRALFSGGDGIDYTAATGAIAVDVATNGGLGFATGQLTINGLADYTSPTGTNVAVGYDGSNNVVIDSSVIEAALPTITASNGLTKTGNDIALGGTLTAANTTINSGGNQFFFNMTGNGSDLRLIQDNNASSSILLNKSQVGSLVFGDGANQIKFTDLRTLGSREGVVYAADYSADFVARSLVDKEYVDNAVSAVTPGTKQEGTVACPVSVANTNFNVTMPATVLTGQPTQFFINGQHHIPVTIAGTTVTFNVGFAVDATDDVEYQFYS